ncbi:MAG: hypothetical protein ACRDE6_01570 [Candidatus Limnocylindria bacterium]
MRNRPSRGLSLAALAAGAVAVVLAAAAIGMLSSVGRSSISSPPPPNASSTHANPSLPAGLATYASESFSFEYPGTWRFIEESINARHYQWIPVVIGTGDWQLNCRAIPPTGDSLGGVTCGADAFSVGPGQVVVEFYTWQGPLVPNQKPPPAAIELPNGLRATVDDGPTTSTWQIYIPGWMQPLTLEARFADPGVEDIRADVRRLVESLIVFPTRTDG